MSDIPTYRILIADCTSSDYHSGNLDQKAVGGIPLVTTRLAEHLAASGHEVHVFNRTSEEGEFQKVYWHHLDHASSAKGAFDFVICNNDTRLFARFRPQIKGGAIPLLWAHNLITYKRLLKKKRIPSLLRYRPHLIVLSDYHKKATPKFLPFRSVTILPHAVDARFFRFQKHTVSQDTHPYAVFVSKSYRGLKPLVELWRKTIHPRMPEARFKAYVGQDEYALFRETPEELRAAGIYLEERLPQDQLMCEIADAHCLFYEGHKDETFCFAAAETTVLGVPIVSRGYGALAERVSEGVNGLLAKSGEEMAEAAIAVLGNAALYQRLSQGARKVSALYAWELRLSDWLSLFSRLKKR